LEDNVVWIEIAGADRLITASIIDGDRGGLLITYSRLPGGLSKGFALLNFGNVPNDRESTINFLD
jgi:hypothetical protein